MTINEILKELTPEMKKDDNIKQFLTEFIIRSKDGNWIQTKNGNGIVELNKENGTLITTVLTDDDYIASYPNTMDCNISNRCSNNCEFCYQGCTPNGKEADLRSFVESDFFKSFKPGMELALNGNDPFHKDLEFFLTRCKEMSLIPNLTVRYNTFVKNKDLLKKWQDEGLLYGIGISVQSNMDFSQFECFKNVVFHTIHGITGADIFEDLFKNRSKVLILGYKDIGLGVDYREKMPLDIISKQDYVIRNISNWIKSVKNGTGFSVLSFDNLAIKQIDVESLLNESEWQRFYRGDEGTTSCYIDLVDMTYSVNSLSSKINRYLIDLSASVENMFDDVKNKRYYIE